MTNSGNLKKLTISNQGSFKIEKKFFTWTGSNKATNSDLTVFGMFDINITKSSLGGQIPKRKISDKTRFVSCSSNELLLAINLNNNKAELTKITNKPVDLTKYAYVLKGKTNILRNCKIGQTIERLKINKKIYHEGEDVCSASFSLGRTNSQLIKNLKQQLGLK
ncbi:hypothetical protein KJ953_03885 [Patescibacteria group bacterium]|nr:hypothetical protein [Patescibacteria group bacterium]MBU1256263.1 hypothetical protein [Patescibacteria group bacterium]MBU1457793.1 hypothetical protein [Patescibacteria group bacterium]